MPQDMWRARSSSFGHWPTRSARPDAGQGERLREGLRVAIAGPPNVGKSTLFNRLARREAAIVSPFPGTTRDVIEVHLDLGGYPVTVLDTAGIRDTDDPVEREGVRRAGEQAAGADLVLWVVDATALAEEGRSRRSAAEQPDRAQLDRGEQDRSWWQPGSQEELNRGSESALRLISYRHDTGPALMDSVDAARALCRAISSPPSRPW